MRVTPSPVRPRRIRLPQPDIGVTLRVTGWRGAMSARIEAGSSEAVRSPFSYLEIFGEPPNWWEKGWKVRAFAVGLYPTATKADAAVPNVGVLAGEKKEWRAHIHVTPEEFARIAVMVCNAKAAQVDFSISKPHYRQATIFSFHIEAGSAVERLTEMGEDD